MDDINSQVGDSLSGPKARAPEPRLESFAKALAKVFRGRNRAESIANSAYFKVFIAESDSGSGLRRSMPSPSPGAAGRKKRVVNYWCFCTGVAMEDLKRLGIRSLILTSGMACAVLCVHLSISP